MRVQPYQPNPFTTGAYGRNPKNIEQVLGVLAGAASTCWENPAGAGEFDSRQASIFVDQALAVINDMICDQVALMAQNLHLPLDMAMKEREDAWAKANPSFGHNPNRRNTESSGLAPGGSSPDPRVAMLRHDDGRNT